MRFWRQHSNRINVKSSTALVQSAGEQCWRGYFQVLEIRQHPALAYPLFIPLLYTPGSLFNVSLLSFPQSRSIQFPYALFFSLIQYFPVSATTRSFSLFFLTQYCLLYTTVLSAFFFSVLNQLFYFFPMCDQVFILSLPHSSQFLWFVYSSTLPVFSLYKLLPSLLQLFAISYPSCYFLFLSFPKPCSPVCSRFTPSTVRLIAFRPSRRSLHI